MKKNLNTTLRSIEEQTPRALVIALFALGGLLSIAAILFGYELWLATAAFVCVAFASLGSESNDAKASPQAAEVRNV